MPQHCGQRPKTDHFLPLSVRSIKGELSARNLEQTHVNPALCVQSTILSCVSCINERSNFRVVPKQNKARETRDTFQGHPRSQIIVAESLSRRLVGVEPLFPYGRGGSPPQRQNAVH